MLVFTSLTVFVAAVGLFALMQRKVSAAPIPVRVRKDGRGARR